MSVNFSFYSKSRDFSTVTWVSRELLRETLEPGKHRQLNTNFLLWLLSSSRLRPKIQKLEHRRSDHSAEYQQETTSESVCGQAIVSTKPKTAGLPSHLWKTSISQFWPLVMCLLRSPACFLLLPHCVCAHEYFGLDSWLLKNKINKE